MEKGKVQQNGSSVACSSSYTNTEQDDDEEDVSAMFPSSAMADSERLTPAPILAARNGVRRIISMIKSEHSVRMRAHKSAHNVESDDLELCDGIHSSYLQSLSFHVCITKRRVSDFLQQCKLWRTNMFMLFPTDNIWLSQSARDTMSEEQIIHAVKIMEDVKDKGVRPWSQRMPLHECAKSRVYVDPINGFKTGQWADLCVCNPGGGMLHCEMFERIMQTRYDGTTNKVDLFGYEMSSTVSIDFDNIMYPARIQGRNVDARIEGSNLTQESVHVRVASGLYQMRDFAGVRGLSATLRYVVVKDAFFCPLSSEAEPLHDCTANACAVHNPYSGFATCTMTAQTLDMSEAMRAQDEYAPVDRSSNTWTQERDDIMKMKRSVLRSDTDLSRGVTRDEISEHNELREDLEYYVGQSASTSGSQNMSNSRARLHEVRRRKSSKMTRAERRRKENVMKSIEKIGIRGESSTANKILNTGHLSSAKDYMTEAIHRLQIAIGTGLRARSSMAGYLTCIVNAEKDLKGATHDEQGVRTIKKYVVPEQEEEMRVQVKSIERDRKVNVEIIVWRNSKKLIDMIDEQIKKIARHALVFWILLRMRTKEGSSRPNAIQFSTFVISFCYMLKEGYSFRPPGRSSDSEHTLLPQNRFLKYMLPNRALLDSIDHMLSERDTYNCVRNIKHILLRHCITEKNPAADISPFSSNNVDMDVEKIQENRPDLFEGLRRRRRTNR